jgi:hypothetical protein
VASEISGVPGSVPAVLRPLLEQFDWGCERLLLRMAGGERDSGNGTLIPDTPVTDAEYLWEPAAETWSVRLRASGPTAKRATMLVGTGEWGRESSESPAPVPPPFTSIAWRLSHLSEMLTLRADYTHGSRALTRDDYVVRGDAAGGITDFEDAAGLWRSALLSVDEAALETVGYCTYPYGSDGEDRFVDIVWWVNQEVLHHGAEVALLRDLYREGYGVS